MAAPRTGANDQGGEDAAARAMPEESRKFLMNGAALGRRAMRNAGIKAK